MRRIGVVVGLVVGLVLGFQGCDAPTFYCVSLETPQHDPPGPGEGCYCKATSQVCGDLGDCISGCPLS